MNTRNLIQKVTLGAGTAFAVVSLFVSLESAHGKKGGKPGGGGGGGGEDPPPEPWTRPVEPIPPGTPVWPQSGRDWRKSGATPFLGPATGVASKWTFAPVGLGSRFDQDVVVDGEGNLIMAHRSGIVCVGRDGTSKWELPLDTRNRRVPAIGQQGTIYVSDYSGGSPGRVTAISPPGDGQATATIGWVYEAGIGAQTGVPFYLYDSQWGVVFVGFTTGEIVALDGNPDAANPLLWSTADLGFDTSWLQGNLAADYLPDGNGGERVVIYAIGDGGQTLYALDGASGAVDWALSLAKRNKRARHPVVGADSTIYVASNNDSRLLAINPDGTLKWSVPVRQKDQVNFWGDARLGLVAVDEFIDAVTDELRTTIYLGVERGVQAFNFDGSLAWKWEDASRRVYGAPAVGGDGIVYLHTVPDSTANVDDVFAISPDGSLLWSAQGPPGSNSGTPIVDTVFAPDGTPLEKIVYVGGSFDVYALHEEIGR